MRHVVRTQVIDLQVDNKLDPFHVQQRMSALFNDDILPLLGRLFDDLSQEDTVIEVDRLELDIGAFSETELSRRYVIEKLLADITEQVYLKLKRGNSGIEYPFGTGPGSLSVFRQWIFYMQHGYLPWNATKPSEKWYQQVLEAGASDHPSVDLLRRQIMENIAVSTRIVLQHPPSFLVHLVELLTAQNQELLPRIVEEFYETITYLRKKYGIAGVPDRRTVERSVWKLILRMTAPASPGNQLSSSLITERLVLENFEPGVAKSIVRSKALLKKIPHSVLAWKKLAAKRDSDPPKHPGEDGVHIRITLPDVAREIASEETFYPDKPAKYTKSMKQLINADSEETAAANETSASRIKQEASEVSGEGLFTGLAGIVLLHPFLYHLYRNMKLADEGKFIDTLSQQKSILLMHYLATGKTAPEEYELVMPKLLCGHPLTEIVDTAIELDGFYLEGAEELLGEVITQWEILGNTSAAGLREGFLQREGKLRLTDECALLQVETHSIDVLLDSLPWNTSHIKLPWMKKILKVEWR